VNVSGGIVNGDEITDYWGDDIKKGVGMVSFVELRRVVLMLGS
jgi:hypothetical protein